VCGVFVERERKSQKLITLDFEKFLAQSGKEEVSRKTRATSAITFSSIAIPSHPPNVALFDTLCYCYASE
jgi:hypothetical protein